MVNSKQHIPFFKMQGAGNDFVVLDNRALGLTEQEIVDLAPSICKRKFGVGSDGILALSAPQKKKVDYTMIYRNPDGSDAGMCGNGARCMALFAEFLGFNERHAFNVHNQVYKAEVNTNNNIVSISFPIEAAVNELTLEGNQLYQIHTGTEHIVLTVDEADLEQEDMLRDKGRRLRYHEQFQPVGTNVNFIHGEQKTAVKLQTYERGVEDLTLACGTGAIASALVWHHLQQIANGDQKVEVKTKGGTLFVHFSFDADTKTYSQIKLEGPAHFVFKGEFLY